MPSATLAQQSIQVVGDDLGGYLAARVIEIGTLQAVGARVEIRGQVCYSSCTMFLGAGDVCVSPTTEFGFHGPSDVDGALDDEAFERWSEIMASHYKPPLRRWFMERARYERGSVLKVRGADLIRLGYPSC